jgi:hypothetical protein
VIAAFRNPTRRIVLAIALSVLIHFVILWLPYIQFPQAKVELPPLSARLDPMPKPVELIAEKPELAKPEPALSATKSDDNLLAKPITKAIAAMNRMEEATAPHPFPRHLQLSFTVYRNTDSFRIGEIDQQLDILGGRYILKSVRKTSGLTSLRNSDQLIQISHGKIGEHGLQPETFEEEKTTKAGKQSLQATFDREEQQLRFSNGEITSLPEDTQDILSFMYQISQLPMNGELFPLPISNGTQLQQYQIEIGAKEDIATPMGKLRTLHLRKMHAQGEAYFEIWLGLEYRLLPVKFRQVDSSDSVTEEIVISGIRSTDE